MSKKVPAKKPRCPFEKETGRNCFRCPEADCICAGTGTSKEEREMNKCGDVPCRPVHLDLVPNQSAPVKAIPERYDYHMKTYHLKKETIEKRLSHMFGDKLRPVVAPLRRKSFCKNPESVSLSPHAFF
ncbi:MAG: hypothetical protein ACI4OH_05270 [Mitsuokella sp.]|uniref:hypothetical protein n=1 Tax=Mitsuokella sp. TaxID=2049034 RepID=UPI003F03100E